MVGEGWEYLGPNGMFNFSDARILQYNSDLIEGGISKDFAIFGPGSTKNADLLGFGEKAMFKSSDAEKFMKKAGYEFLMEESYNDISSWNYMALMTTSGNVVVNHKNGEIMVTKRAYHIKGSWLSNVKSISYENNNLGTFSNGYQIIDKSTYIYSKPNIITSILDLAKPIWDFFDSIKNVQEVKSGNVKVIYDWKDASKNLLMYKNK